MTHLEGPRKRRPRYPFWKDEKIAPGLTTAGGARLFIIIVMISFVVMGLSGFYVLDLQSKLGTAIKTGRVARLEDQARTDALIKTNQARDDKAIRDLACFAAAFSPPGSSVVADELRLKYDCPKYKAGANPGLNPLPQASPGVASPTPGASSTATSTTQGQPGASLVPAPSASGSLRPSSVPPGPTTPRPSASPSQSPVVNLPSVTCGLIGVFCP
jgi:hypothetical protein